MTSGMYALCNLTKLCPTYILKIAYFGLFYPYLQYGVRLLGASSKHNLDRVFLSQNNGHNYSIFKPQIVVYRDAFRELGFSYFAVYLRV